jgi:hypothetical protein
MFFFWSADDTVGHSRRRPCWAVNGYRTLHHVIKQPCRCVQQTSSDLLSDRVCTVGGGKQGECRSSAALPTSRWCSSPQEPTDLRHFVGQKCNPSRCAAFHETLQEFQFTAFENQTAVARSRGATAAALPRPCVRKVAHLCGIDFKECFDAIRTQIHEQQMVVRNAVSDARCSARSCTPADSAGRRSRHDFSCF